MPQPAKFYVSLKVILKNKKGEILGLKSHKNSTMAGYYDLPGGRIDPDELEIPFSKIIQREMKEEIGKDVRFSLKEKPVAISRHIAFSPKLNKEIRIFMVFFEAKYISGRIKISNEHTSFKWLKLTSSSLSKLFTKGILEGLKNYLRNKK